MKHLLSLHRPQTAAMPAAELRNEPLQGTDRNYAQCFSWWPLLLRIQRSRAKLCEAGETETHSRRQVLSAASATAASTWRWRSWSWWRTWGCSASWRRPQVPGAGSVGGGLSGATGRHRRTREQSPLGARGRHRPVPHSPGPALLVALQTLPGWRKRR